MRCGGGPATIQDDAWPESNRGARQRAKHDFGSEGGEKQDRERRNLCGMPVR